MSWLINKKTQEDYLQCCRDAVNDEKVFANFKQDPRYTKILEHSSKEQGRDYLNAIIKDQGVEWIINFKDRFIINDRYGGSTTHVYKVAGICFLCAPSTLKYIKVSSDLLKYFGRLSGISITEIGVGYGGQRLILNNLIWYNSYNVIDCPEVLELEEKYFWKCSNDIEIACKIKDGTLLISNYAYSELDKKLQDSYFEKFISKCSKGYMTYNKTKGSYTVQETAKQIKKKLKVKCDILPENISGSRSEILVWGHR